MKRKRILYLIAAVLVASICGMTSVYAADVTYTDTFIYGGEVKAYAGDEVVFPVYISGNPGIASLRIDLTYDTDALALIEENAEVKSQSVEKGEALTSGNVIAKTTKSGCQIFWWSDKNVDKDGELFRVHLKTSEAASPEKYSVKISYYPKDTGNENEEAVELLCKNGAITLDSTDSVIYGGTIRMKAGETIDYPIYIRNNPGLSAVMVYVRLAASETEIEAVLDDEGSIIAEPGDFTKNGSVLANHYLSGWKIMWYTTDGDQSGDGKLFSLKLKARENVTSGDVGVVITCMPDNTTNADGQKVNIVSTAKGTIKVRGLLYGDLDDNLTLDFADAIYFKRYLAGWNKYSITDNAIANLNCDDKIDNADVMILERHIAGWSGYATLPKVS